MTADKGKRQPKKRFSRLGKAKRKAMLIRWIAIAVAAAMLLVLLLPLFLSSSSIF